MSAYIICFASGLKVLPQSQQDLTTGTSRWTSWTGAVRTRLVCSQTGAPTYLPQHLCRSGKPATNALALSRMFSYLVRTKLESSAGRAEGLVVPGSMPWPSSWVRERVETQGPQGSGSKRLVCRNRAATPWRNFAPFTTSTFIDIHASAQAWENAGDRQWVRDT